MPVQVDTPSGVGATNLWGVYGPSATDKVQAVSTVDADASVIYGVSGGRLTRQLYTFPQLTGVADPVTAAQVSFQAKKYANGGGAQKFYAVWNSTRMATNLWSALLTTAYFGMGEATSGAGLVLAAVNGEHGVDVEAAGGPSNPAEVWVTYLYRQVTYTFSAVPGAGDFSYLISSMIGGLIGGNLLLRDMPGLARVLRRVWKGGRNVCLLDHELEPAWQDWRTFRRPAYSR